MKRHFLFKCFTFFLAHCFFFASIVPSWAEASRFTRSHLRTKPLSASDGGVSSFVSELQGKPAFSTIARDGSLKNSPPVIRRMAGDIGRLLENTPDQQAMGEGVAEIMRRRIFKDREAFARQIDLAGLIEEARRKSPEDLHYTRRELYYSPKWGYSLVVIIYLKNDKLSFGGEMTPVHNHGGKTCVFGIFEGDGKELHFDEKWRRNGKAELLFTREHEIHTGDIEIITATHDPIHVVGNFALSDHVVEIAWYEESLSVVGVDTFEPVRGTLPWPVTVSDLLMWGELREGSVFQTDVKHVYPPAKDGGSKDASSGKALAKKLFEAAIVRKDLLEGAREAARSFGYEVTIDPRPLSGYVEDEADRIIAAIEEAQNEKPRVLLWSGHTKVELPPKIKTGKGGPNSHLALEVARDLRLYGLEGVSFLAASTSGRDGRWNRSGAIVTDQTYEEAEEAGLDVTESLERYDSGTLLEQLEELEEGTTVTIDRPGTDAMDIVIAIVPPRPEAKDGGSRERIRAIASMAIEQNYPLIQFLSRVSTGEMNEEDRGSVKNIRAELGTLLLGHVRWRKPNWDFLQLEAKFGAIQGEILYRTTRAATLLNALTLKDEREVGQARKYAAQILGDIRQWATDEDSLRPQWQAPQGPDGKVIVDRKYVDYREAVHGDGTHWNNAAIVGLLEALEEIPGLKEKLKAFAETGETFIAAEFGAGNGPLTQVLRLLFQKYGVKYRILATDVNAAWFADAYRRFREEANDPSVEFYLTRSEDEAGRPFSDFESVAATIGGQKAHLVIGSHSIHLIDGFESFVNGVKQALLPGGIFAVQSLNVDFPGRRLQDGKGAYLIDTTANDAHDLAVEVIRTNGDFKTYRELVTEEAVAKALPKRRQTFPIVRDQKYYLDALKASGFEVLAPYQSDGVTVYPAHYTRVRYEDWKKFLTLELLRNGILPELDPPRDVSSETRGAMLKAQREVIGIAVDRLFERMRGIGSPFAQKDQFLAASTVMIAGLPASARDGDDRVAPEALRSVSELNDIDAKPVLSDFDLQRIILTLTSLDRYEETLRHQLRAALTTYFKARSPHTLSRIYGMAEAMNHAQVVEEYLGEEEAAIARRKKVWSLNEATHAPVWIRIGKKKEINGGPTAYEFRRMAHLNRSLGLTKTPLVRSESLSGRYGRNVWWKLEPTNPTGSQKDRLRSYIFAETSRRLREKHKVSHLITASTGNQAIAVAEAGNLMRQLFPEDLKEMKIVVYVSKDIVPEKEARLKELGAEVRKRDELHEEGEGLANYEAARRLASFLASQEPDRRVFVPHGTEVLASFGTIGLEMVEQLKTQGVDPTQEKIAVIVPMGSAGMAAGIERALSALGVDAMMIGVQVPGANSMVQSLFSGEKVSLGTRELKTLHDGIATSEPEVDAGLVRDRFYSAAVLGESRGLRAAYEMHREGETYEDPVLREGLKGELSAALPAAFLSKYNYLISPEIKHVILIATGKAKGERIGHWLREVGRILEQGLTEDGEERALETLAERLIEESSSDGGRRRSRPKPIDIANATVAPLRNNLDGLSVLLQYMGEQDRAVTLQRRRQLRHIIQALKENLGRLLQLPEVHRQIPGENEWAIRYSPRTKVGSLEKSIEDLVDDVDTLASVREATPELLTIVHRSFTDAAAELEMLRNRLVIADLVEWIREHFAGKERISTLSDLPRLISYAGMRGMGVFIKNALLIAGYDISERSFWTVARLPKETAHDGGQRARPEEFARDEAVKRTHAERREALVAYLEGILSETRPTQGPPVVFLDETTFQLADRFVLSGEEVNQFIKPSSIFQTIQGGRLFFPSHLGEDPKQVGQFKEEGRRWIESARDGGSGREVLRQTIEDAIGQMPTHLETWRGLARSVRGLSSLERRTEAELSEDHLLVNRLFDSPTMNTTTPEYIDWGEYIGIRMSVLAAARKLSSSAHDGANRSWRIDDPYGIVPGGRIIGNTADGTEVRRVDSTYELPKGLWTYWHGHDALYILHNPTLGYRAYIGVHRFVPFGDSVWVMGGTQMAKYGSEEEALARTLSISEGMSRKIAMAGLLWDEKKQGGVGGGVVVIDFDPASPQKQTVVKSVTKLLGRLKVILTGQDQNIGEQDTLFMAGIAPDIMVGVEQRRIEERLPFDGIPPPDPAARGVFLGLGVGAEFAFPDKTLEGKRISLQGVGKVGWVLLEILLEKTKTTKIVVADKDPNVIKGLKLYFKDTIASGRLKVLEADQAGALYDVPGDVFIPTATEKVITEQTAQRLIRAEYKLIGGSANDPIQRPTIEQNSHLTETVAKLLHYTGVWYAPDYVINAGGLIAVGSEIFDYSAEERLQAIPETLRTVFTIARRDRKSPLEVANAMADVRIHEVTRSRFFVGVEPWKVPGAYRPFAGDGGTKMGALEEVVATLPQEISAETDPRHHDGRLIGKDGFKNIMDVIEDDVFTLEEFLERIDRKAEEKLRPELSPFAKALLKQLLAQEAARRESPKLHALAEQIQVPAAELLTTERIQEDLEAAKRIVKEVLVGL